MSKRIKPKSLIGPSTGVTKFSALTDLEDSDVNTFSTTAVNEILLTTVSGANSAYLDLTQDYFDIFTSQTSGVQADIIGQGNVNPIIAIVAQKGSDFAQLTIAVGTDNLPKVTVEGNLKLITVGNGIYIKEGTNATMGTATLSGGTVVVSTTKVTANSRIFITVNGGTLTNVGSTYVSARTAGTSFTISSTNILDASTLAWILMEPL